MNINKLKEELLNLWVDYLGFVDCASEEKVRNMIESQIELYHLRGVEKELIAIQSNLDAMIDDKEIFDKFHSRFVKYNDILLDLKKEYERE